MPNQQFLKEMLGEKEASIKTLQLNIKDDDK